MVAAEGKAYVIGTSDSAITVQEVALSNGTMATMVCLMSSTQTCCMHLITAVNCLKEFETFVSKCMYLPIPLLCDMN